MRFVVLGAGRQGSACAYDLLRQPDVTEVILVDLRVNGLPPFLDGLRGPRLVLRPADFRDPGSVADALHGGDVALCAAPYYFNYDLAKAAVAAGLHFADLGGNTEIVFRQRGLDAEARARGVTLVPDVGLAPGIVNVLAAEGVRRLDVAEDVRIFVGGLPQAPEPPLHYQVVYSLEGVLDYYTTPSWIVRDGRRTQVDALSEVEPVEFPGLGTLEAFHTGGGISTLPWTYEGKVRRMEYKTLRYPGHAGIVRAIRELGLLDTEPVKVKGAHVRPRDVFVAVVGPRLTKPEMRDVVALRVEVAGAKGGRRVRHTWECIDRYDEATGISAMERTTGFTLSIIGLMMARGEIAHGGVRTPDDAVPAEPFVRALAERGIRIEHCENERGRVVST